MIEPYVGGMREAMKIIKTILFSLAGLIVAVCLGILICALNPSLTDSLAQKVQAMQGSPAGSQDGAVGGSRGAGVLPEGVPGVNADWLADRENTGYLVPDDTPGNPPAAVGGRTGYEPVSGDAQQVLPEEADTVAPGELGEAFTFDPNYYPYYAMLETDLRQLYNQIYANASQLITSFTPVVDVDLERLKRTFEAVYNDHPELFWLETGFSCKYLEDGTCVEITLDYNEAINDIEAARQMFLGQAEVILAQARTLQSDYQRERYVHDILAERVEYDLNGVMNQSAYSGLVTSRTVCAGYSRAFQYLMQQMGIPCYYCTGYAGQDHAWNIVRIGGEYYNVDVTWDDTAELTHDYFNKSDAEFAPTHVRTGLSVYLPACMGTVFGGDVAEQGQEQADDQTTADGQTEADDVQATEEPMRPLVWESRGKTEAEMEEEQREAAERQREEAEQQRLQNLEKAGITEADVLDTMEEYYKDCKEQLKKVGVGDQMFSNVVPSTLWSAVEQAYSSGSYHSGYADEVLKEFGVKNFYIQLQVQNLGGGYYRVYHNVLTN